METKYLLTLLYGMGLGPNVLTTIQAMYKSPTANLLINGKHSNFILLKRVSFVHASIYPLYRTSCTPLLGAIQ